MEETPAQPDCPDDRKCESSCGTGPCSRRCTVCQRLAGLPTAPCPACPDALPRLDVLVADGNVVTISPDTKQQTALQLAPSEKMVLTIARSQLERGVTPGENTITVLVMIIDRLVAGETAEELYGAGPIQPAGWHGAEEGRAPGDVGHQGLADHP